MERAKYASAHLNLRLTVLNRGCRQAVYAQMAEAKQLDRPELVDRCISDRQVMNLLDRVDTFAVGSPGGNTGLTEDDRVAEDELRALAAASAIRLPLDELRDRYRLTEHDELGLVAVAAPELDRAYERLYAYIADEFDRRFPSVEVLLTLTAEAGERYTRRGALGPYGALRSSGLVEPIGSACTGLRQELRLAPGLLEYLLGSGIDVGTLGDLHTPGVRGGSPRRQVPAVVQRLANLLRSGELDIVNLWGAQPATLVETARAMAHVTGAVLHPVTPGPIANAPAVEGELQAAFHRAASAGATLLISADEIDDSVRATFSDALVSLLAQSHQPVVVTTSAPWRPAAVVAARAFADLEIAEPDASHRTALWEASADLSAGIAEDIAARFPLTGETIAAAASYARAAASLASEQMTSSSATMLERACIAVTAGGSGRFVTFVSPRRGPSDLVVPENVHRQIVEIATFTRALPAVNEGWGFEHLGTGRGLKVLFIGDPGTGKTLAAEVIASMLGVPLLLVDLAQVVSKWVGETAQHLDEVFRGAGSRNAVLFFDEADALFGRRGEVRHGTDRYANTEVSHLLQRFERHDGLVILATNLRENIDPAFTRRFHLVTHFPRPSAADRLRLWRQAFPTQAPIDGDVDLESLAGLDMTGASIVSAARMGALIAADTGAERIAMSHVIQGVARQYRSEARVITPAELGEHGLLLEE